MILTKTKKSLNMNERMWCVALLSVLGDYSTVKLCNYSQLSIASFRGLFHFLLAGMLNCVKLFKSAVIGCELHWAEWNSFFLWGSAVPFFFVQWQKLRLCLCRVGSVSVGCAWHADSAPVSRHGCARAWRRIKKNFQTGQHYSWRKWMWTATWERWGADKVERRK